MGSGDVSGGFGYHVVKAVGEKRYTFGPLYAPERLDAHGEYTDAETLQEAVWEYVRQSAGRGRRINLQHGDLGDVQVGEWVEVAAWPYEHTIKIRKPGEREREVKMPAGTVYMGIRWDEDAWALVKTGRLGGLSLGGRAKRAPTPGVTLAPMGDVHKATLARLVERAATRDLELDALMEKIAAGESAGVPPSTSAPPAAKHHSREQMRSDDGKFRTSRWRKVVNASAQLDGFEFFGR